MKTFIAFTAVILCCAVILAEGRPTYRQGSQDKAYNYNEPQQGIAVDQADDDASYSGFGNALKKLIFDRYAKSQIDSKIQAYKIMRSDGTYTRQRY